MSTAKHRHTTSMLLDLRIQGDTITENYLSDASLGTIAKSYLQYFAYKISSGYYYKEELDGLSGKGILALVSDCRRLEVLELENAKRVGREAFEEILKMLALARESSAVAKAVVSDDDGMFALGKIILAGYPFVVTGNPLRLEDTPDSNQARENPVPSFRDRLSAELGRRMNRR
eukprot:scaffold2051_cov71-Skeletonema_dohrnii-CCMP3373.AAC.1